MNGDDVSTELAQEVAKQSVKVIEGEHSFAQELIANARRDGKRWFIVVLVLAAILVFREWDHSVKTENLNLQFANTIETINQQHLDYLALYDFSGTTEITVDGKDGTALYQDGEGNVLNNGVGGEEGNEIQN